MPHMPSKDIEEVQNLLPQIYRSLSFRPIRTVHPILKGIKSIWHEFKQRRGSKRLPRKIPELIALASLFVVTPALAAPDQPGAEEYELDPIVVTARGYKQQPVSANIFSQQAIARRGILSAQDVFDDIPNIHRADTGTRSFVDTISIRGLGNTPVFSSTSVGFYLDDVPFFGSFTYANRLYGLENIEVYRGPQGTLFGKNSHGGLISVRTKTPGNQHHGGISAQYGNFDSKSFDGYANGPLIADYFYYSIGLAYEERDGYLDNTFLNTRPDDLQTTSGRASFRWTPDTRWDIRASVSLDEFDDGSYRFVPLTGDPFEVRSDTHGRNRQDRNTEALRIEYESEGFKVLSVTSRSEWNLDPLILDLDFSPVPAAITRSKQQLEQWTQELRIRLNKIDSAWDWNIGAFFSTAERRENRLFNLFTDTERIDYTLAEKDFAVFGNIVFQRHPAWRVSAGLRLDYGSRKMDRSKITPLGSIFRRKESKDFLYASPKLGFDFIITPTLLLYASTGLSFKPGSFSPSPDEPRLADYDNERAWASEIGFRSLWLADRIEANLALFYYDIDDYEVERFIGLGQFAVFNAEKAISWGAELELNADLFAGFALKTSAGYTNIRLEKHRDPISGENLSGNKAPFASGFNSLIALENAQPWGFFTRLEWVATGRVFFDDLNRSSLKQTAYSLFNARVGYEGKQFSVYAFGDNLTDERYFSFMDATVPEGTPGAPQTFGLRLQLSL